MYRLIKGRADQTGLEAGSVDQVVTSPPYWGQREYHGDQVVEWAEVTYRPLEWAPALTIPPMVCALGAEQDPAAFVGHLIATLREQWRVLTRWGSAWVNLGDSYAGNKKGNTNGGPSSGLKNDGRREESRQKSNSSFYADMQGMIFHKKIPHGLKEKDLIGIPWLFALAARADGWYLRRDAIWAKGVSGQEIGRQKFLNALLEAGLTPEQLEAVLNAYDPFVGNAKPESVEDRPVTTHEYIFLLSKGPRYFYDATAVREPGTSGPGKRAGAGAFRGAGHFRGGASGPANRAGRDLTNVGYATGTRNLRSVWAINTRPYKNAHFATYPEALPALCIQAGTSARGVCPVCRAPWVRNAGTWAPTCDCGADPIPAVVLDPFNGSGTTGAAALALGRDYIGLDLCESYLAQLTEQRLATIQPTINGLEW